MIKKLKLKWYRLTEWEREDYKLQALIWSVAIALIAVISFILSKT